MDGVFGRRVSLVVSFWSSRAHLLHTSRRLVDEHWWGASGVDGSGIASGVNGGAVKVVVGYGSFLAVLSVALWFRAWRTADLRSELASRFSSRTWWRAS
jgi:hypothetical protein